MSTRMLPQNQPGRHRIEHVEADLVATGSVILLGAGVQHEVTGWNSDGESVTFILRNLNHPDRLTEHTARREGLIRVKNW